MTLTIHSSIKFGAAINTDGGASEYTDGMRPFSDQELSQIRVEDTPAWFLLRPQIRLTGDVTVTRFERGQNALRLAMTETKQADLGSLTLVLSDHPLELRQWTVIDAQQKPITVALEDPHYGVALSPSLGTSNRAAQLQRPIRRRSSGMLTLGFALRARRLAPTGVPSGPAVASRAHT